MLPSSLARAEDFALEEIAPGVFMRRGVDREASPENLDAIANIGFIVGDEAVLVTESGGSLADGVRLRKAIREKTAKPIKYVVLSHVHPDHVFGAGAFLDDAPAYIGHAKLGPALAARGDFYRQRLIALLGEANVGPVVMPNENRGGAGGGRSRRPRGGAAGAQAGAYHVGPLDVRSRERPVPASRSAFRRAHALA